MTEFTKEQKEFMLIAIKLSIANVPKKRGPFGAVVVKDGKIIAKAANRVTVDNDPTAHAEVVAIRKACKVLKSFQLTGCEIYTSCEPCPMCLAAIYWARPSKIFYANTKSDAAAIGFDDSFIYDEIGKGMTERMIPSEQMMNEDALVAFDKWKKSLDKIEY